MQLQEIEKLIVSQESTPQQKRLLREVLLLMKLHNAKDSVEVMAKITAIRFEEVARD